MEECKISIIPSCRSMRTWMHIFYLIHMLPNRLAELWLLCEIKRQNSVYQCMDVWTVPK